MQEKDAPKTAIRNSSKNKGFIKKLKANCSFKTCPIGYEIIWYLKNVMIKKNIFLFESISELIAATPIDASTLARNFYSNSIGLVLNTHDINV